MTVYSREIQGANCDLDWDFIREHSAARDYFVAIPYVALHEGYEYGSCGRCLRLKCNCAAHQSQFPYACNGANGREVTVMVINSCPSCHGVGDLDLSFQAWDAVTGYQSASR